MTNKGRERESERVQDSIQTAGEKVERGINQSHGEKWHQIKTFKNKKK